ncbi:response regulator transcription factor [Quadrisphaera sp. KR29]|uniref:response regulator transcription factor n=1 Tax=Quadrisphaera sp. KR29 TaxID=3461391 RepID=UPI00404482FD
MTPVTAEAGEPLRVVVADDHPLVRRGLRGLLTGAGGFAVVAEAEDADGAVAACRAHRPDVAVLDLRMPGGGVAAAQEVVRAVPGTAVLVLTMHRDPVLLRAALAAGARGYLLKDAPAEEVLRAVSAVAAGQLIFDPGVAGFVVSASATAPAPEALLPELTPRQVQVLRLAAGGASNAAVAARLGLSLKTVQNHVSDLVAALGVQDRSEAVALARQRGVRGPSR